MSDSKVYIYTDGACSGNPGRGGWGALLRFGDTEKTLSGAELETTNNRMELTAPIMALRALNRHCEIEITTDSKYVMDGITKWIHNWQKNNWRTANRKPVLNDDLWKELLAETKKHNITWKWVKGHSGHRENEIVDELARNAIDTL